MSANKKMNPHEVFIVELFDRTQSVLTTKQCATTTVFRLPKNTRERLLYGSLYNEDATAANKTANSIDTHRSRTPQRLEYNELLLKYRERLKLERKKHLKILDDQTGYCIKGGQVIHNRQTPKFMSQGHSDQSLSRPKIDFQKAYRIINDIRQQKKSNKTIVNQLSKLPFLRKRHADKHERTPRKRVLGELKEPVSTALSPTRKKQPQLKAVEETYELVPWRDTNDDGFLDYQDLL